MMRNQGCQTHLVALLSAALAMLNIYALYLVWTRLFKSGFAIHHFVGLFSMFAQPMLENYCRSKETTTSTQFENQSTVTHYQDEKDRFAILERIVQQIPCQVFAQSSSDCSTEANMELSDADNILPFHSSRIMLAKRRPIPVHGVLDDKNAKYVYNHCSDKCCICLETYRGGDTLKVLPVCGHGFHGACLEKWVYSFATRENQCHHKDPTCPLCKKVLCPPDSHGKQ